MQRCCHDSSLSAVCGHRRSLCDYTQGDYTVLHCVITCAVTSAESLQCVVEPQAASWSTTLRSEALDFLIAYGWRYSVHCCAPWSNQRLGAQAVVRACHKLLRTITVAVLVVALAMLAGPQPSANVYQTLHR
jgi:hypothetical protein